ncbi:MarR family winged helix-turn-helix transcriptional regulator [Nocardioides sp. CFH 31398]|uniref:MarR family winged helix-turn-helix transcriptional regulator n=1 Tax=Nocardioides sp. CFH 31398 TaxID=2919579 RepID=UPI001F06C11F|nr:MarR family transcriptional regulator [Nocardioides sp. CFH 31398]MCH1865280.1 MarR family transcriptional regulator [Nocardioides sp. CFH 31398]
MTADDPRGEVGRRRAGPDGRRATTSRQRRRVSTRAQQLSSPCMIPQLLATDGVSDLYEELEKQLLRVARNLREPTVLPDGTVVLRVTASLLYLLHASQPIRVGAIASAFGIDPSTSTRQVQHAVKLGLIEGVSDPDDRRARLLAMTPAGRDLRTRVVEQQRQGLIRLLARWAGHDRTELVRLLSQFNIEIDKRRPQRSAEAELLYGSS